MDRKTLISLEMIIAMTAIGLLGGCERQTIPNPAAEYCIEQGGTHTLITETDGSQYGICTLPGGTECDEWAFYRKECPDCGSMCPLYSPPAPGWCEHGTIVDGGKDDCGCQLPPKCENVACTEEAKICPDGVTVVAREGPNCEFAPCPDKTYVSTDLEKCMIIRYQCDEGMVPFSDSIGCGCEAELEKNYCTPESRLADACITLYQPVCGWFSSDVMCIKYPCAIDVGNSCEACKHENVEYWTEGLCPGTPGSGE